MRSLSRGFQRSWLGLAFVVLTAAACTNSSEGANTTTVPTTESAVTTELATTTTEAVPLLSGDPAELEAALSAGREILPRPYVYAELAPICDDGCDTSAVQAYFKPDPEDTTKRRAVEAWRDDVSFDPSDQIWIGDPILIAEDLLTAVANGDEVSWEIDSATGLVTSWAVNGSGVSYNCLNVDTAPLEIRDRTCSGSEFLR